MSHPSEMFMDYHDDNFGFWEDMDDPDAVDFYNRVQSESVKKTCSICEQTVMLRPSYDKCDSCCRKLEAGWQY